MSAKPAERQRLYVYNGGFLNPRLRRILTLAGYDLRLGAPVGPDDAVAVWGQSPTAPRGEAVAALTGRPVVRIEDAFLRSIRTGREGAPPGGLLIDRSGVHFDPAHASDLERLLATHPLDDTALLNRARVAMARMQAAHLSKYSAFDPTLAAPEPGYVLLIDQTRGDASIRASGATAATMREMFFAARDDHPGARIVIRTHPETDAGARPGHFGPEDANGAMGPVELSSAAISPWRMLEGAVSVYTLSSQMGFEAILAGHRPQVFGQPFYAGWGLSEDRHPLPRRHRKLTRAQLFAAAMILYPTWYDPARDRLCTLEERLDQTEAEVRAFREDRRGHLAVGVRAWKRGRMQEMFGGERPVRFAPARARPGAVAGQARAEGRGLLVWGDTPVAADAPHVLRIEDGFLRSRGLGAALVPPLSLVTDDQGLPSDPRTPNRFEALVAAGPPPGGEERAERLVARIVAGAFSKYNLPAPALPPLPDDSRPRILVPGQVEDDASLRHGAGPVATNRALLTEVRALNPGALILWKPHPDVAAGLRPGAIDWAEARTWADVEVPQGDPAPVLGLVDRVWTMTSTLGFEALLRGVPVTCLGAPFYAGWGLTTDLWPPPGRRRARPTLAALAHACLIGAPRYFDPVSRRPCPPEVILDRLERNELPHAGTGLRLLSKAQGWLAGQAWLWRQGRVQRL